MAEGGPRKTAPARLNWFETAQQRALKQAERELVQYMDVNQFSQMRCLTTQDTQEIKAKQDKKGDVSAAALLCHTLPKRINWWSELMETLRSDEVKQSHLAEMLDSEFVSVLTSRQKHLKTKGADNVNRRLRIRRLKKRNLLRMKLRVEGVEETKGEVAHQKSKLEQYLELLIGAYGQTPKGVATKLIVREFQTLQHVCDKFEELIDHNGVTVASIRTGCICITLKCDSLEALDEVRKIHSSGAFSEFCSEIFLSREIKSKFGLGKIPFEITLNEADFNLCEREILLEMSALDSEDVSEDEDSDEECEAPSSETAANGDEEEDTVEESKVSLFYMEDHTIEELKLYIAAGADPNKRNKSGWTPLMNYCDRLDRDPAVIVTLVKHLAPITNLDAQDAHGQTALHAIIQSVSVLEITPVLSDAILEVAASILAEGPDLSLENKKGHTARQYLAWLREWREGEKGELLLKLQDMVEDTENPIESPSEDIVEDAENPIESPSEDMVEDAENPIESPSV